MIAVWMVQSAVDEIVDMVAMCGQVLDRLICRFVLAEANRVMCHREGRADLHHRREPDRWAAIVRKAAFVKVSEPARTASQPRH
jgi:hypothetical protein